LNGALNGELNGELKLEPDPEPIPPVPDAIAPPETTRAYFVS
jgi:hypothetical protein